MSLISIMKWIDYDETLRNWWKSSQQRKREFAREHRDELVAYIRLRIVNELTEAIA